MPAIPVERLADGVAEGGGAAAEGTVERAVIDHERLVPLVACLLEFSDDGIEQTQDGLHPPRRGADLRRAPGFLEHTFQKLPGGQRLGVCGEAELLMRRALEIDEGDA